MNPDFSLSGGVALVTGAGSGIGRAIALGLAAAGANVGCLDRVPANAEAAAAEILAAGSRAVPVAADVTDPAAMAAAVTRTESALGPLTLGVNAAGIASAAIRFHVREQPDVPRIRPLRVSVAERLGSSGQVASGRIGRDQGDGTRLRTCGDGCRCPGPLSLGSSLAPGTKGAASDANLARFQVDRCLGIASCCVPRIAGRFVAWCRLVGDCCQAGASMGRPAAWAASSRRLS
jgi:short chain dehydrogenase